MYPPTTTNRQAQRHALWATWSPLLVLGGSAITATLLIQLGLSALGPASAFVDGVSAAAPSTPVPIETQVAVVAAPRER
jgi:hypothetical protein